MSVSKYVYMSNNQSDTYVLVTLNIVLKSFQNQHIHNFHLQYMVLSQVNNERGIIPCVMCGKGTL